MSQAIPPISIGSLTTSHPVPDAQDGLPARRIFLCTFRIVSGARSPSRAGSLEMCPAHNNFWL